MASQIEATFTVNGDHSAVVVRMVDGRGGKRRFSRSRSVRLGVGRDALAGMSLSTALLYLSYGLKAAALQRGGDRVPGSSDMGEASEPLGGLRGESWSQPTLDLT